ncbi:MAG: c-type cytochrome [Ignavibacteriaceae bacterium]|nr:c-type cytochrome [Ignavibacteriaceae bacterium]
MKNLLIFVLFILSIVILYGFVYSIGQTNNGGKQLFIDKKCTMCHSVSSQNIKSPKKDAADLSNTGEGKTIELLKQYLKKEQKINDKEHKTAFKGTEEELDEIVRWLETLKTPSEVIKE